ncbi:hypothetical protein RJ639_008215 [Escallonia herrerae]|uniref:Uncharacterized protein n=1 Tax=Escallonia herrerae TaxID=1293975 RepID=A0AA88VXL8_9ASTE|nr:hypothetical protein RJ639_008215 [Escallonia herrerae]
MAARLTSRLASHLLRTTAATTTFHRSLHHHHHHLYSRIFTATTSPIFQFTPNLHQIHPFTLRLFSTARRQQVRPARPDIAARARQLQTRRLWTYALTFSCIAGFIVIVLNQFQDQLVFYVTPTDALAKHAANPTQTKFRLGGLVLEGSTNQPAGSPEMEFVVTDLITDILVRYQGSLPDLFREGHSVVVEGFVRPFTEEMRKEGAGKASTEKARGLECYFAATEVLAKHDEKYMPKEVADAIEKNKKKIAAEGGGGGEEHGKEETITAAASAASEE